MTDKIASVQFGRQGPSVGVQGLGCMGMSDFYGARDDIQSLATLNHAVDRGVTMIDTADMYGMGHNEELVGKLLRGRRDEVFIATKFGIERKADDPSYFGVNNHPDYIRKCVDASLQRLGIDTIDLYYMHRRDRAVPLADSVGTLGDLVSAGKIHFIGLSEVSGDELREAHAIHPVAAVQSEWSLFSRDVEQSVVPQAAELGIAFVAYSPLGRGMFTDAPAASGSADPADVRKWMPRFSGENGEANARLVETVREVARQRQLTAAQVALAWVHARSAVHGLTVIPIPGTRNIGRLDENLAAASVTLDAEELEKLDSLAEHVQGERMI